MNDDDFSRVLIVVVLGVIFGIFAEYLGLSRMALIQVIIRFLMWGILLVYTIKVEIFKRFMPWILGTLFFVISPAIEYWSIEYSFGENIVYAWWSAWYVFAVVYFAIVWIIYFISRKFNQY